MECTCNYFEQCVCGGGGRGGRVYMLNWLGPTASGEIYQSPIFTIMEHVQSPSDKQQAIDNPMIWLVVQMSVKDAHEVVYIHVSAYIMYRSLVIE